MVVFHSVCIAGEQELSVSLFSPLKHLLEKQKKKAGREEQEKRTGIVASYSYKLTVNPYLRSLSRMRRKGS